MTYRNLTIIWVTAILSLACYQKAAHNRYGLLFSQVLDTVSNRYVYGADRRDLFTYSMEGMTDRLDAPSTYFDEEEYTQFRADLSQQFPGIGIQVNLDPEMNRPRVISPLVDSPAYKAGLLADDLILEINGQSTEGLGLEEAVHLLRGKERTSVTLTILHKGAEEPVEISIERAVIHVESVKGDTRLPERGWDFTLRESPQIGYVRIQRFGKETLEEVGNALSGLDVRGLVIDLRGNRGGSLPAAVGVCDYFIDEGMIVSLRGRHQQVIEQHVATPQGTIVDRQMQVVVLINHDSASASEIVAACLQDHERATIIGERSFGKGTVQNLIDLEGGRTALKLTVATYWRPSGVDINRPVGESAEEEWGVSPNEGFAMEISDDDLRRMYEQRVQWDVVTDHLDPPHGEGDNEEETSQEASRFDPVLERAVEYLEGVIEGPQEAAA